MFEDFSTKDLVGSDDIKMLLDKIQAKHAEAKKAAQEAKTKNTEVSTSSFISKTKAKEVEKLPRPPTPRPIF